MLTPEKSISRAGARLTPTIIYVMENGGLAMNAQELWHSQYNGVPAALATSFQLGAHAHVMPSWLPLPACSTHLLDATASMQLDMSAVSTSPNGLTPNDFLELAKSAMAAGGLLTAFPMSSELLSNGGTSGGSSTAAGMVASQVAKSQDSCYWSHEGRDVLVCRAGTPPPFTVFENADSVKMVFSTFNMTAALDNHPNGVRMTLERNRAKLDHCALSYMPSVEWPEDGGPIVLDIMLSNAFDRESVEVNETKTRVKVIITKKATAR
jgi:hypothetical protein